MTEPTTQALIELRRLAEAASALDHNERLKWYTADELLPSAIYPKNARYMAALPPPKVIELLDALEAQTLDLDVQAGSIDAVQAANQRIASERDALRAELAAIRSQKPDLNDLLQGKLVSMDVSTGEDDAYNRVFGRVCEVMLQSCGAGEDTILAIEESRNFAAPVVDVNAGLVGLPKEDTEEANKAITSMLAEYQYPANPQNAGRAGWRAARLYTARTQQAQKGGE